MHAVGRRAVDEAKALLRRLSVSALLVPLAFCSGAMTSIWPKPCMACASAASPGAR